MEKHIPKTETRYDDLAGAVSVNFKDNVNFNEFASRVCGIDINRFEPVSLRLFAHKEIIITIYAIDRMQYEDHKSRTGKIPVRKFKLEVSPARLLDFFKQVDCTLVSGDQNVEDFEVVY